ncbi:MAG: transcription termination/antitermination protein NusA [Caldilineaceae bacterium]|nr:transcription termination/antitermination protein NusA [Caldilineaceae bacterium]HRJ41876.1 transcription termination factor NusA [Caldilineaceae bacterium]
MSKALIAGINQVASDKGLDHEVIFSAIEAALISAYKRNFGSVADVTAAVDRFTGDMKVFAGKEVVEDVMNPSTEVLLKEAQKAHPNAKLGDVVPVPSAPANFGRIAAQTAKQVILQRIREAERDTVYENFIHRVGEIINAQVRSIDLSSGTVTVLLGEKHESLLPREEQIPNERLRRGDYIRLYVVDVHKSNRGPVIKLSRTHRNLLRRLMEQEIPEVRDGTVEIKAISREPGNRSKVAVVATVPGVDPVGSCVGMRGMRIQNIVTDLAGEKIDVVEWSGELRTYIANALSPAKVQSVILEENNTVKTAMVIVPDRQLSLAIGKEGQNARLAAKLTGWRIDIKSESEAQAEGLDLVAAQQAQMAASGQDLMALAERFLRQSPTTDFGSDDLLRKAAQEIQKRDAELDMEEEDRVIPSWPVDGLPSLDLGPRTERLDSQAALDAFEDAAAAVAAEIPPRPFADLFEPESETSEEGVPEFEMPPLSEEFVEPQETVHLPEEPASQPGELPSVITVDMLRQRMAERRPKFDDIEVPPELLGDYDIEDEIEEEGDDARGGKRGKDRKAKPAPAKRPAARAQKRPKRRQGLVDDDESDYSFG